MVTEAWPGVASHPADYSFVVDDLHITLNGNSNAFDDSFDGSNNPGNPSDTLLFNGQAVTYAVNGSAYNAGDPTTYLPLNGNGGAQLTAAGSTPGTSLGNGQPVTSNSATLKTDTTGSGNGLHQADDFTVSAEFDLTLPNDIGEGYGIRLSDKQSNTLIGNPSNGDDVLELSVRKGNNGVVAVQFRDLDFVAGTSTNLQSIGFNTFALANATNIVLHLTHAANSTAVTASYELLELEWGGSPVLRLQFQRGGHDFQRRNLDPGAACRHLVHDGPHVLSGDLWRADRRSERQLDLPDAEQFHRGESARCWRDRA